MNLLSMTFGPRGVLSLHLKQGDSRIGRPSWKPKCKFPALEVLEKLLDGLRGASGGGKRRNICSEIKQECNNGMF